MAYIEWEWYNGHFPKLSEEGFRSKLPRAEMTIDTLTHGRSRTAEGYKLEAVMACTANVINALAAQEETGAGTGVSSVSNDGYSESYANATAEQADADIRSVCLKWLSGTGLTGAL